MAMIQMQGAAAATRNTSRECHPDANNDPATSGLAIAPMRPTASAQPTPLARIGVGYRIAANAFSTICDP
jgi:hypothetical protein